MLWSRFCERLKNFRRVVLSGMTITQKVPIRIYWDKEKKNTTSVFTFDLKKKKKEEAKLHGYLIYALYYITY